MAKIEHGRGILLACSTSRWLASLSLSGSRDVKITDEFGSI